MAGCHIRTPIFAFVGALCRFDFSAGNEYRKVELLDVNVPTMGVDYIRRINPYYHFFSMPTVRVKIMCMMRIRMAHL